MPNNETFKSIGESGDAVDIFRVIKPVYVSKPIEPVTRLYRTLSSFEEMGIEVKTFSFIRHNRHILMVFVYSDVCTLLPCVSK
jgi:hypothetical protein